MRGVLPRSEDSSTDPKKAAESCRESAEWGETLPASVLLSGGGTVLEESLRCSLSERRSAAAPADDKPAFDPLPREEASSCRLPSFRRGMRSGILASALWRSSTDSSSDKLPSDASLSRSATDSRLEPYRLGVYRLSERRRTSPERSSTQAAGCAFLFEKIIFVTTSAESEPPPCPLSFTAAAALGRGC